MRVDARLGPRHPWLGAAGFRFSLPMLRAMFAHSRLHGPEDRFTNARLAAVRRKLERGETVYLAGIGPSGHNSGVALLEVSRDRGTTIICNNEEERFSGKKHCTAFPDHAIADLLDTLASLGLTCDRIDAWLATWDYAALSATFLRTMLEEFPASLSMVRPSAFPKLNVSHLWQASRAPRMLARRLGAAGQVPIIGMPHHDNHAWYSFGVSPFVHSRDPVMISVLDGTGDLGAISLYSAERGRIARLSCNGSVFDSLGLYYSFVSSTQGGWTMLSSEGRYMGAAAWGNADRLTNPYYMPLREIFSFQQDGNIYLNRSLANWPRKLFDEPYTAQLKEILGRPIPPAEMWNPDAVLKVDESGGTDHAQSRFDKAAAAQMVFEDALCHVIGSLIRRTGSHQLVLTGGTALNGVATMRLMEHFDGAFYERYTGKKDTSLHVWTPPTPGDAGVTMGAAYSFACLAGAPFGPPIEHAFYCGAAPSSAGIERALGSVTEIGWESLGDVSDPEWRNAVADLVAYITAHDGVVAIFQGRAETGPRALGHRSIVANPCNPRTLEVLNTHVKYREAVRPLAPMATFEAARRWFDLPDGASDADYNAFNYMVLTARAKPEACARIPAVIHRDKTARVQIVRPHIDPFMHAYLRALGRRIGVEVAVNTSFNVAGPIVQSDVQALETLKRSNGLDAAILIADDGRAFAAWHNVNQPPKDEGKRFRAWLAEWYVEVGVSA